MLGVSLPHHNYVQPKTDAAHKTVETIGILHFKIQAVIIMWLSSIFYFKKKHIYIYWWHPTTYYFISIWLNFQFLGTQCEEDALLSEVRRLQEENMLWKEQFKWSVKKLENQATRFYTGLPSFAVLMWLFR